MNMPLHHPNEINESFRAKRRKQIVKARRKAKKKSQQPMMFIPNKRYHK